MRKKHAFILLLFLFFSSILLLSQWSRTECKLVEKTSVTECTPYSEVLEVRGGEFIGFSQRYVYSIKTGDSFDVFLNGEEDNWTRRLGVVPPCVLWGESINVDVPSNVRTLTLYVNYGDGRCPGTNFKPPSTKIGTANATGGRVEIAYYFVPTKRGKWVFWPEPVFGGTITPKIIEGHCSCSLKNILESIDGRMQALNFVEVASSQAHMSAGPLKLSSYKLYKRGDEHVYVECTTIRGMGLARILLVKGAKDDIMPYINIWKMNKTVQQ